MSKIVAKNIGRIGNRAIIEILAISQDYRTVSNYSLSASIDTAYGFGISLFCPYFLLEINMLPLVSKTMYGKDY